jgi:hypothetical protein
VPHQALAAESAAQRQPPSDCRFDADSVPAGTGECAAGGRARRDALPGRAEPGRGMRLLLPGAAGAASATAQRLRREEAVAGRAFLERWPGVSQASAEEHDGRGIIDDSRRLLRGEDGRAGHGGGEVRIPCGPVHALAEYDALAECSEKWKREEGRNGRRP